MVKTPLFPVYEFRPLAEIASRGLKRFAGGKWIDDDGEHDLAFIGFVGAPMVYYITIPYQRNILWKFCHGGNWGAVVDQHPRGNAWHYMLRDGEREWGGAWGRETHENEVVGRKAMDETARQYRGANGSGPEFDCNDAYMRDGLVRVRETREIVTVPDPFECMYCGIIHPPYGVQVEVLKTGGEIA